MRASYIKPLLLLALVQLLGCSGAAAPPKSGTARPPAVVESDEPQWTRLQSAHFDIATDLDAPDATRAAEALETTRAALLSAAWPGRSDDVAARTTVVIFRDGLEFMQYFENIAAIYVSFVRPTVVLWGKPDYWEQKTGLSASASSSLLRHELTHRLANSVFARQPRWFAEGIAQFLETMNIAPDGTKATVGEALPEALYNYKAYRVRVSEALAWKSLADHDQKTTLGLYGVSWLMVHWLQDKRPKDFDAFQRALMDGVDPERAWHDTLGRLRPEVLDAEIAEYVNRRSFKSVVVPIERTAVQPTTKASITEADVHAIRAQLALAGAGTRADGSKLVEDAQRELLRALTLEPANPLALRLLLSGSKGKLRTEEMSRRLRAQLEKRPDDGEAWLLLAETGLPEEREEAAHKAIALMPGNPDASVALAFELLATDRAKEALPIARKATSLAPWDSRAHHAYAAALIRVGRCAEAVAAETRAIEVLPDKRTNSALERDLRLKLDEYRRSCARGRRR